MHLPGNILPYSTYGERSVIAMLLALLILVLGLGTCVVCLLMRVSSLHRIIRRHERMIMSQGLAIGKHTTWLNK